jgi:hypothetical protein
MRQLPGGCAKAFWLAHANARHNGDSNRLGVKSTPATIEADLSSLINTSGEEK